MNSSVIQFRVAKESLSEELLIFSRIVALNEDELKQFSAEKSLKSPISERNETAARKFIVDTFQSLLSKYPTSVEVTNMLIYVLIEFNERMTRSC
jgi:hypothetical protein